MTDQGMQAKLETAAHDGNLVHYKRSMDQRVHAFHDALREFNDSSLEVEMSDGIPVAVSTRLGRVEMKPVYGLDDQRVGVWIVFSDKNPDPNGDPVRHLLAVHLSDTGWIGTSGQVFADRFGRHSIFELATAIAAEQLRWNTKFIKSISAPV